MNNTRRRQLANALVLVREAMDLIEQVQSEEQDYYDTMPESFQNGQKGETAQEVIDNLEQYRGDIGEAADQLDEIIGGVSPSPDHVEALRKSLTEVTLIAAPTLPAAILKRANAALKL